MEFTHRPDRWHASAVLPDVQRQLRLGRGRKSQIRLPPTPGDEGVLPAALFLDSQSHSRVLLQRRTRDQMDVQTGFAPFSGSDQLRLKLRPSQERVIRSQ